MSKFVIPHLLPWFSSPAWRHSFRAIPSLHKPARGHARGIRFGLILGCGLAIGLPSAWAGGGDLSKLPPPSTARNVTYEKDVRPILEKTCFGCHGPKTQKGKLRLDSLEAVLTGGKDGKVLEKRSSAKSMIVKMVARLDPDNVMPPKGTPLTEEQIGLIRAWIDQGTK